MAYRKTRTTVRRSKPRSTTRSTTRRNAAGTPWSREELSFLRKYYRNNETAWVARQLGRTVYSVRYKASDLSIKKANPSVWRGATGETSARKPIRRTATKKTAWNAKSRRSARPSSRRATTRKTTARRKNRR
ncbi:MAG: hypothetical protein KKA42_09150 [candidate division Zixibacteria bacterium]|nr:hypothetical protein [candidate division Zixibacteria bacterium]